MNTPKYHGKLFIWILIGLVVFDTIFTFVGYKYGILEEGNPLMRYLWGHGDAAFLSSRFVVTIAVVSLMTLPKEYSRIIEFVSVYCIASYIMLYGVALFS